MAQLAPYLIQAAISTAISLVISAITAQDIEGPKQPDNNTQTSTYGRFIPIAYGRIRLAGNVIWSSGICEIAEEQDQGKGGKGSYTQYTYYSNWATALCEGRVQTFHRVWFDTDLVYDADSTDPDVLDSNAKFLEFVTFYYGTETQDVDPLMEAALGLNNSPAYRGVAYMVFENIPLTNFGNRIPNVLVELSRFPDSSATTEVYPIEGLESLNASARCAFLHSYMAHIAIPPEAVNPVSTITSGSLVTVVAYETYIMPPEAVDTASGVASGSLVTVVAYETYVMQPEAVDTISGIPSGSLVTVVDYIDYTNWPAEAVNTTSGITGGTLV